MLEERYSGMFADPGGVPSANGSGRGNAAANDGGTAMLKRGCWVPDDASETCMLCDRRFGTL